MSGDTRHTACMHGRTVKQSILLLTPPRMHPRTPGVLDRVARALVLQAPNVRGEQTTSIDIDIDVVCALGEDPLFVVGEYAVHTRDALVSAAAQQYHELCQELAHGRTAVVRVEDGVRLVLDTPRAPAVHSGDRRRQTPM